MPRRALVVALLVVVAACGGDDDADDGTTTSESTTSSTESAESSTSTTAATPSSAPPSSVDDVTFDQPGAAADCLFEAWLADDLEAAQTCADDIAVDELFSRPSDGAADSMTSQGCFEEELHFRCAWTYEGGSMGMLVVDSDAYGWRVSDIEYVAD